MHKRLLWLYIILVIIILVSCADHSNAYVSPMVTQTRAQTPVISPAAETSVSPVTTPSPLPSSAGFIPDTDIPDIVGIPNNIAANSNNYCFYEDTDNIYYLAGDLFLINKTDWSERTLISNIDLFTLYDHKIYCVDESSSSWTKIMMVDPATGKTSLLKKLKNVICGILGYGNKLYIGYNTKYEERYDFQLFDLYSLSLDGDRMTKIVKNVRTYCIYEDMIYYTRSDYPDGSPFYKCNLDGSDVQQIFEWNMWPFQIINGKIFFDDGDNKIYNISTGEMIPMPRYDDIYGYAVAGQYLIYILPSADLKTQYVYAYDINTGKTYQLMQTNFDPLDYPLYTTPYGAYFGDVPIYKIIINDGKASLVQIDTDTE